MFAAVTIALAAMSVTSCGNKQDAKAPAGTPIGDGLFMVENTLEDGTKTVQLQDSTGYAVGDTYAAVADSGSYLVARKTSGAFELLSVKGGSFANAGSFEVKPYYATGETAPAGRFLKTLIAANNNHLAFDVATHQRLIAVEGIKDNVLPLDNGYTLFQIKGLWGVAKADAEEPITSEATEIAVITTKAGKTYFWFNSKTNGAGVVDETGKAVKRLSPAQFKLLKKGGKKLWDEGGASAIVVKAI